MTAASLRAEVAALQGEVCALRDRCMRAEGEVELLTRQLKRAILQHKAETETANAYRQEATAPGIVAGSAHVLSPAPSPMAHLLSPHQSSPGDADHSPAAQERQMTVDQAVEAALARAKVTHEHTLHAVQARMRQQDALLSQRDAQVRSLTRMLADAKAQMEASTLVAQQPAGAATRIAAARTSAACSQHELPQGLIAE